MNTGKALLIILGVALLAIVGLPLLFMSGMMSTMMGSGMTWGLGGIVVLVVLASAGLIASGLAHRS
jgi:polyferredoxin